MIYLRGHHLRLLYGYTIAKKSPVSLENKKKSIVQTAIVDGHGKAHGLHIINVLENALNPDAKIKMVDTIDDICKTCEKRGKKACREFIPYDISATSDDRATLHYYGLSRRVYTSKFIQKRILEKGYC